MFTPLRALLLSAILTLTAPETASFTVSADGSHTLEFRGINPGDHTAFLSYVTITPTER